MNSPVKVMAFRDHEVVFLESIISLLEYLNTLDPVGDPASDFEGDRSVARIYRDLFRSIDMLYQKPQLGKTVPMNTIKQLINQLILLLVEQKLEKYGDVYVKVINVNCVKIIEHSDHTVVLW